MSLECETSASEHGTPPSVKTITDAEVTECSETQSYGIQHTTTALEAFQGVSPRGLMFYRVAGCIVATLFASCYYMVPVVSILLPFWLLLSHFSIGAVTFAAIWLALAVMPPNKMSTPSNKFYTSVPLYFNAALYFEDKHDVYEKHPKPIIYLCYPHGTISFGGWSLGSLGAFRPFVSAVADVLCIMPILRQFFIGFNIVSGSRQSLRRELGHHKRDVVLYPGGLAELFLSNSEKEELYFNRRKGCIKLAMETGADVVVCYLFGNTLFYKLYASAASAHISRVLRSSITAFWGPYGLIPPKVPVVAVSSVIIKLPDYSKDPSALTPEVIEEHHATVKDHIQRVFDSYKHLHPQYADKKLHIS